MLKSDEIADVLSFYPVLSSLYPSLVRDFVESSTSFHCEADTVLFDYTTLIQSYVLLTSGTVRVSRRVRRRELVLYQINPGGCCVLAACNILSEAFFQASGTAGSRIRGVAIPAVLFRQMFEGSPAFSASIIRSFSIRLSELLAHIDATHFVRLDARLANLLLLKGTVVRVTHSQLAGELGTVREVISRILKDFEIKGLVRLERNQIAILDEQALLNIARNR